LSRQTTRCLTNHHAWARILAAADEYEVDS
jgi:hypothetical protein